MSTAATAAHARQPDRAEVEANARRCDEEWKRGVVVVSAAPRMLTIETTSRCNLRCVMCHHGLRPADPAYEHFPEALTDRLRGVIRLATYVQLHGLGEPLLNSEFWNMLELTHENQYVQINSNGLLLDGSTADRLVATGLDEVSFSLDAATPETYRKIRGADFTRTIANIRVFALHQKRIASDEVIHFLTHMLYYHRKRHLVVLMDNASPHTSKKTMTFIDSQPRLHVFNFPSYSHDWNPDEKVWNHLKHHELKSHKAKTKDELTTLANKKLNGMANNPSLVRGLSYRCCVADLFG